MKAALWKWIWHPSEHGKTRLYDVGIEADGTLRNPNGYDEEVVRRAIERAKARSAERRKAAAVKAVATRKRRHAQRVHGAARMLLRGQGIGPQRRCCICCRKLDDEASINRGVGSECWQGLLEYMATISEAPRKELADI